ncbi:MAG: ATP-dependent metallopeptidase FtsH/Yme1/Tma family protein, partial [Candidatus Hydrothermia bacterium]
MKNDIVRNLIIWVLIFFVFITLYNYLATGRGIIEISYTDFYSEIENGNVSEVVVTGKNVEGSFKAPKSEGNREYLRFKVQLPYDDPELVKMLATKDIQVYSKEKSMLWTVILSSIPWLLMLVLFWFVFF